MRLAQEKRKLPSVVGPGKTSTPYLPRRCHGTEKRTSPLLILVLRGRPSRSAGKLETTSLKQPRGTSGVGERERVMCQDKNYLKKTRGFNRWRPRGDNLLKQRGNNMICLEKTGKERKGLPRPLNEPNILITRAVLWPQSVKPLNGVEPQDVFKKCGGKKKSIT